MTLLSLRVYELAVMLGEGTSRAVGSRVLFCRESGYRDLRFGGHEEKSVESFAGARSACLLRPVLSHASFTGADYGLRAIRNLQLREDVGDVVAHGLEAQEELPGYLPVVLAGGN